MKIGEKEFELEFKYYGLKKVAEHLGVDLDAVPAKVQQLAKNAQKLADLAIVCVYYGCNAFQSIDEIEKAVTTSEEITPAAFAYLDAFKGFFGIKADGEQAKTAAH